MGTLYRENRIESPHYTGLYAILFTIVFLATSFIPKEYLLNSQLFPLMATSIPLIMTSSNVVSTKSVILLVSIHSYLTMQSITLDNELLGMSYVSFIPLIGISVLIYIAVKKSKTIKEYEENYFSLITILVILITLTAISINHTDLKSLSLVTAVSTLTLTVLLIYRALREIKFNPHVRGARIVILSVNLIIFTNLITNLIKH